VFLYTDFSKEGCRSVTNFANHGVAGIEVQSSMKVGVNKW